MSAIPSKSSTRICTLWVDWLPQSENEIRKQHWTKNHAHGNAAKAAWLSAYQSSPAAIDFWMRTITLLGASAFETRSADTSDSTTMTPVLSGNTDSSAQTEPKGQS